MLYDNLPDSLACDALQQIKFHRAHTRIYQWEIKTKKDADKKVRPKKKKEQQSGPGLKDSLRC